MLQARCGILECVRWFVYRKETTIMKDQIKTKIASIIRHLLTGASAWAVNSEWLSATDADTAVKAVATVVAIVVSRLIIYGAEKIE